MTAEKKKKRRERKPNPTILVLGNPPPEGAELFGDRVTLLEYHHIEDEDNILRVHDFGPDVLLYALADGNVLLSSAKKGLPLWGHH